MPSNRVKTPTVIQMEVTECGAAALGIVLGYYGLHTSLEELRVRCGVSRDGVNAFNMIEAAKFYGLTAEGYSLKAEHISEATIPSILYWENNHFVVLEGFKNDRIYINDPATGPRWVEHKEFVKYYSNVVLEMRPGPDFKQAGAPPTILDVIKKRLPSYKSSIVYLLVLQFLLVLLGLALPVFIQIFIDKILGQSQLSWIKEYIALFVGVIFVTTFLTWIQGNFFNALQIRLSIRYSTQFLWHILQLPMSFFTQRYGSEIINRMRLNTQVANVLTGPAIISFINLLLVGVYAFIMVQYDVWITLIGIVTGLANLIFLYKISQYRQNVYTRFQSDQAKTIGVSLDTLQHIETVKASGKESFFFSRIAESYTKNINSLQNIGYKDAWLFSFSFFSQQMATLFVLGFGTWRVIHGHLTVGMLIALQLILSNFLKPFRQLVEFGARMQMLKIDINRLDDVLKNKTDPLLKPIEKGGQLKEKFKGNLEFHNVTFGYNPLAPPVISNFNLKLSKGKWVALVGATGAGKSTIAKLASSLYIPWKGYILYDGNEFSHYERTVLMRSLSSIEQEIILFSGTIKDNLTLWDSKVTEEMIERATKDACIHEDILKCPEGYLSQVAEDGTNFSSGQRQRLEIARALVLNPSLLIMDESTNALDSETEERVFGNLRKRNCSCLVIAHRISTARFCDEIVVIDKGNILQTGTHESLKNSGGPYQEFLKLEERLNG